MKNISFDNPYLLLLIIPLLLLIIVPHLIAIRKTNRSISTTLSLILHILMVLVVVPAIAGMKHTTVITKTEVYVVADMSYSADESKDKIDEYIRTLDNKLPNNSEYGVICFGKDYVLHTEMGAAFTTVKDSGVDESATNISAALEYAGTLFGDDVIKRVLLITDGKETAADGNAALVRAVENLYANGVYVDAVYLDSNVDSDTHEVQIEGAVAANNTYLNHTSEVTVLIRSARSEKATLTVKRGEEVISTNIVDLISGFNVENIPLPTDKEGIFDYEVSVEAIGDYSPHNNKYPFSQKVSGELKVLVSATSADDVKTILALYGENAELDIYYLNDSIKKKDTVESLFGGTPNLENATIHLNDKNLPCTPEELCLYDEIMLVNTDVREVNNYTAFIDSLDKTVSVFGKSLVTIGDNKIQNKTDDILVKLENMLPAKYGNSDRDPKLYAVVIDMSLSMVNNYRFESAKAAACQLVNLMLPTDEVAVYAFYGATEFVVHPPTSASKSTEICKKINALEAKNGTSIGAALNQTHQRIRGLENSEKQVYLISDGIKGGFESYSATTVAANMRAEGIFVSAINVHNPDNSAVNLMRSIAINGGGEYYFIDSYDNVTDILLAEVADDITESVIEAPTDIDVNREHDTVLAGVNGLPTIGGFVYARVESSANTVLTVDHTKASGGISTSVLYSYWNYGNGRVASYNGKISGAWAEGFTTDPDGETFLKNILVSNIPKERVDYPYSIKTEYDGTNTSVTVTPAVLNPDATLVAEIVTPGGERITETLVFDSSKYFYSFNTELYGKYEINLTYSYSGMEFKSSSFFSRSYSPEYDRFASYSPSPILRALGDKGILSEEGVPTLVNNADEVGTYIIRFTIPLMIIAAALYVVDIVIRKLRWADIRSLFVRQRRR